MKKIKEVANQYGYRGIKRGVFVYILGPIALGTGFVTGFVEGVIHSIKG